MRELGTFLALFLGIAFDVVDAWEPPPYGSVGTNQCLSNFNNPDTYTMVKSYFDKDLAIKYCELTPGCNIVVKIDRSQVRGFRVRKKSPITGHKISLGLTTNLRNRKHQNGTMSIQKLFTGYTR